MISIGHIWGLFKEAASRWVEDRAPSMGAALAYYTAFSLAPLLIIVIAIAGLVFGQEAAQGAIMDQIQGLLGEEGGQAIQSMLANASDLGTGITATVIGFAALILGATTAFVELQDDLDRIWKAPPRAGSGIINLIRSRLLSFGMILGIGFLLTVSLVLSGAISALGKYFFADMEAVLQVANFVVSFAVITLLFAMIYKILPNIQIEWKDVWVGAAITALLFALGKSLIGLYIGKSSVSTSFGGAGPFVVLMVWIYYSTQIFLFGAEFTRVHAGKTEPEGAASQAGAPGVVQHAASPAASHIAQTRTTTPTIAYSRRAVLRSSAQPGLLRRLGAVTSAGFVSGILVNLYLDRRLGHRD